jgi:hypothetical protein
LRNAENAFLIVPRLFCVSQTTGCAQSQITCEIYVVWQLLIGSPWRRRLQGRGTMRLAKAGHAGLPSFVIEAAALPGQCNAGFLIVPTLFHSSRRTEDEEKPNPSCGIFVLSPAKQNGRLSAADAGARVARLAKRAGHISFSIEGPVLSKEANT